MKYTDEQLSRILSAAAVDGLKAEGANGTGVPCCLVQAAECMDGIMEAVQFDLERAGWFDRIAYERTIGPDAMLRALEKKGWA